MTMKRRSLLQSLLAAPLALLFKPQQKKQTVEVQTLEHDGWGFVEFPERIISTQYMTRWTFSTHEKAEEFVRSLYPRLAEIWLLKNGHLDQIRSGYRRAVRAQFNGSIQRMQVEIVHKQSDGTYSSTVLLHRPMFDSVQDAWGWLSNIRVDGQPVSRKNSPNGISEYLAQPFIKGNPKMNYEEPFYFPYRVPQFTTMRSLVGE
jgi:hypothetical protein